MTNKYAYCVYVGKAICKKKNTKKKFTQDELWRVVSRGNVAHLIVLDVRI